MPAGISALIGQYPLWEWVEILNLGGSSVDLDGWVFDDDDDTSLADANISSAGGTRNTIVPAGGVAVLYPGDELNFMPQRFTDAWGSGLTMIGVDGFTALTATDSIGLWPSHAAYAADAIPMATSSPRRTFSSAAAAIDYSNEFPDPVNGRSIAWAGSGAVSSGGNWVESEAGSLGAFESTETFLAGAQVNSTNDRGSPGVPAPGPAAAGLLITEIMFAPESPLATTGFAESDFEWIEIYNNTAAAIDFGATPYVLDDVAGSQLGEANIATGSLAVGETGVLFNSTRISADDMRTMWGPSLTYLPVSHWPQLNNSGPETIAIWDSTGDYNSEPVTGPGRTHDNAVASVVYQTTAAAGWPTVNNESSIWLSNLSGDPDSGANWIRAGTDGDTLSGQAEPIFQTVTDHEGGDVGSPGHVPGVPPVGLDGDFNGDGHVNAADYVAWRKSNGSPTDYNKWRANFGASSSGSGSASDPATFVPEPMGSVLTICAAMVLSFSRARSRRASVDYPQVRARRKRTRLKAVKTAALTDC